MTIDQNRTPPQRLPVVLAGAVACMFFVAGVAKLTDLAAFAGDLSEWSVIPASIRWAALLVVPPIEVVIAGLWLIGARRAFAVRAMAGLLVLFSSAYVMQLALGAAPSCGCLGKLAAFHRVQRDAAFVLVRNGVLLGMIFVSVALERWNLRVRGNGPCGARAHRQAGFTLIEAVLVVAIVGLLVGLLLPSLAKARDAGREVVSASNLRSHCQVVNAYLGDWDDSFPWFTDPDATYTIFRVEGRALKLSYFHACAFWNLALAPGYYQGDLLHPSFAAPGRDVSYVMTDYLYSCTFLAGSDFWEQQRRAGPSQWRCVRASEVEFPAQKGVYYAPNYSGTTWKDGAPAFVSRERRGIGCVDGSAEFRAVGGFRAGYPTGEGHWPGSFHATGSGPVMHTISGSRGMDIDR